MLCIFYETMIHTPVKLFMAQGFKRTGNAFSAKKSSVSSSTSSGSNKIRKGSRFIAPKKTAAMAKANLTHKLTAQLNRRAESALITRMGGNREGCLLYTSRRG